MHYLESFAIPVKTDSEIFAYYGKTEKDSYFIEYESVAYTNKEIDNCLEFLNETYDMNMEEMILSIQTKKPVNDNLTLLFRLDDEFLIYTAEVTNNE